MTTPEEARAMANELWPFAEAVSNTGHPEKDNNFGRVHSALIDLANQVESLQADAERYRWLCEHNFYGRGGYLLAEIPWPMDFTKNEAIDAARKAK